MQELGQHIGGVGGQRVFPAPNTPVVDEGALAHGVDAGKFGGRDGAGDLAPLGAAAVDIATDSEVSEMLSEVFPADNT